MRCREAFKSNSTNKDCIELCFIFFPVPSKKHQTMTTTENAVWQDYTANESEEDAFLDGGDDAEGGGGEVETSGNDDIHVCRNADGKEVFVFDPYNPLNQEITADEVQSVLRRYGLDIPVTNLALFRRAFVHRSYLRRPRFENAANRVVIADRPSGCVPLSTKSNETLEFVGDGVLDCVVKFYLYRRFPKQNEGFITEKKIALVKNEAIGKIALDMGLYKWFILSRHAEHKQTRSNLKKLGCLFEAFVGAVFLDFNKIRVEDADAWFRNVFVCGPGFHAAQIFIERVIETHVDWVKLLISDDNFKNILQIRVQKQFKVTPHYLEYSGNDGGVNDWPLGGHGYRMGVYLCLGQPVFGLVHADASKIDDLPSATHRASGVGGGGSASDESAAAFARVHALVERQNGRAFVFLGSGTHKIKKKAEQLACEDALRRLELLKFHVV